MVLAGLGMSTTTFLTSMASSGMLRNAKMSDTDITIARAKSGSLRLLLEETEAAYAFDTKQELEMAKLAASRRTVSAASSEKVMIRADYTRGTVSELDDQLAAEADVERGEVDRRCNTLEAERVAKARQEIIRERRLERHRNRGMHAKVVVMRQRKDRFVDDTADRMREIEQRQGRAATLVKSRTEERLSALKVRTEWRERKLVEGQAVRDSLAQAREQFRERTRQRLNQRSAHVDATRADLVVAQAERDEAAAEERSAVTALGRSLSEDALNKSTSWQQLKAERHEELMREKLNARGQALAGAREQKKLMLRAYQEKREEDVRQRNERYHQAMQHVKDKQDAFEAQRQEAERQRLQRLQKGQLTFAAINDVAIKHTHAHRSVQDKHNLLALLKL